MSCPECIHPEPGCDFGVPWTDCLEDRYDEYGPNCAQSPKNPSNTSTYFVDSLTLDIFAPSFAQQNTPFDLTAIVTNISSVTLESLFVLVSTRIYAQDTANFYQVTDSVAFIDSIPPQSADTLMWEVVPLSFGKSIPLSVYLFAEGVLLTDVALQNVNKAGTDPDLMIKYGLDTTLVPPGSYTTIFVSLRDTLFSVVADAVVRSNIISVDEEGYSDTVVMYFNDTDSLYYGTAVLPSDAPLGAYLCQVIATKPGFEIDTALAYFSVIPTISLSVSSDTNSYTILDTLSLVATVTARDSLVSDANLSVTFGLPEDTIVAPMAFDTTQGYYEMGVIWSDFLDNSTERTLPNGTWEVTVIAWWNGREVTDTVFFALKVPDLSISPSDLSYNPSNPSSGDLIAVSAKVYNVGDYTSDSSQICFYFDLMDDSHMAGPPCPIPPVPPGENIMLSVILDTEGYGGNRTLYAAIDPDSSIVQCSRDNDTASLSIEIEGYTTGDVNGDATMNLSDVIYLANYLLKGGPEPIPDKWMGDVNCDDLINLSDVIYLANYLLKGGPPPCVR